MFWLIFGPIVLIAVAWSVYVGFSYHGSRLVFGGDTCWFDRELLRKRTALVHVYTILLSLSSAQLEHYDLLLCAGLRCLRHQLLLLRAHTDTHQRRSGH